MRPDVFIVESLRKGDEREGKIISSLLRMGGKAPVYRYVKTLEKLKDAIEEFYASDYRYLHISSHGNSKEFCFRFGHLDFKEFAHLLRDKLRQRRIFVSACKCVNSDFANLLIPSSGCYSIIGPYEAIDFDLAAIVWASYYYLAFRKDQTFMNRQKIVRRLKRLSTLFKVNLNYYSPSGGGIKRKRFVGGRRKAPKK